MPPPRTRPYDVFAPFYDRAYAAWRGPSALRQYRKLLEPHLEGVRVACDLACGTGALAAELAARGLTVYAVDRHPAMVALARARARRSRGRMRVIEADLGRFHLPDRAGLATCFFDSLNHLTRRGDLARVFARVREALEPGGPFVFDVNTIEGVARRWPESVDVASGRRRGRRWVRIARALPFDRVRLRGGTELEWFLETSPGRFQRSVERYWEIAWPSGEVERALEEAGFELLEVLDGSVVEAGLDRGLRTYFRARRRGVR